MKWETKKIDESKWGIFLIQKFCKTDEPVCYSVSTSKAVADIGVERLNKSFKDDNEETSESNCD